MEQDIADYLYSVQFWLLWDGKEESLDTASAKARAIAEARFNALQQTFSLQDATQRSLIYQLYRFQREGWHHILGEYDSIKELLLNMLDHLDPNSNQVYQLRFVIEELLPWMEQKGVPPETVTGLPDAFSKAMEAVPRLRRALERDDIEEAKEIIEKVTDPGTTVRSLRDWLQDRKPVPLEKITMETYVLPDGEEIIVLRPPSQAHRRFIETALRNIIDDMQTHSAIVLMRELGETFLEKA